MKICKLARILSTLSIIDVHQQAVAFLYFFFGLSRDRYFSRIMDDVHKIRKIKKGRYENLIVTVLPKITK